MQVLSEQRAIEPDGIAKRKRIQPTYRPDDVQ
jgi:hypothetical protein